MLFNLNDEIRFRTTKEGTAYLLEYSAKAEAEAKAALRGDPRGVISKNSTLPYRREDGLWMMPFWEFCMVFGPGMAQGGPQFFKDNKLFVNDELGRRAAAFVAGADITDPDWLASRSFEALKASIAKENEI